MTTYLMRGYFHNRHVFSEVCIPFWNSLLTSLESSVSIPNTISYSDSLIVHLRFGDYLNECNSKIYTLVTPQQILAILTKLTHYSHYYYVTDSPSQALTFFSSPFLRSNSFTDLSSSSREQDLVTLSKFSCIICSNSTYSVLGSILSYVRSPSLPKTFFFPSQWFLDGGLNDSYYHDFLKYIPSSSFY
jgi:hypothetical protein